MVLKLVLGNIAVVQRKSGDRKGSSETFRTLLEFADNIKDRQQKLYALEGIATLQAEAGDTTGALTTAAELKAKLGLIEAAGVDTTYTAIAVNEAYVNIALSLAETGDHDSAVKTLEFVDDNFWKSMALAYLATFQWKAADHRSTGRRAAEKTFQRAEATARLVKSVSLPTHALAAVAEARASIGQIEEARKLIDEAMRVAEAEPNARSRRNALESVTSAQAASGDVDGILATVSAIKRAQAAMNLQAALLATKSGDWKTAFDYVTSVGWSSVNSIVLCNVARAHSKSGDFAAAHKVVSSMSDQNWRSHALCDISSDQVDGGKLADAEETCDAIDENFYKARALSSVALAKTKAGHLQVALSLFEQAREVAIAAVAEDTNNANILREIAANETEAGRVSASFRWAGRQQSPLSRANALLGVADGMLKTMHASQDTND